MTAARGTRALGTESAGFGEPNVTITVTVNGMSVTEQVPTRLNLADFLRHRLGLTGTHVGCEQGVCGMCTVLVDGEAVKSCLMFAAQLDQHAVETVESLAEDRTLSPLQERFKEEHALQCGFCTPGFLMTTTALAREPRPTPLSRQEIKEELAGVLCRCTGYEFIVTAVERHLASLAADSSDDEVSVRDLASAAGDRADEDVSVGDLASATGDSSHG